MPRIELLDVPLFKASDPIHYRYDNIPLTALIRRQEAINRAVDDLIEQMRDAIGTQNTVANRLNQSIDPDGNLKTTAVDQALHDMSAHTDNDIHVKMTRDESE